MRVGFSTARTTAEAKANNPWCLVTYQTGPGHMLFESLQDCEAWRRANVTGESEVASSDSPLRPDA